MTKISIDSFPRQSENNINILNSKISNKLLLTSSTCSASDDAESSLKSPSAQPLAYLKSSIRLIGVSLYTPESRHPDRRKLKISTIREDASQQQYSCALTHYNRKRELMSNLPDQYKSWEGYRDALDFISSLPDKENAYIGKMKNTTAYQRGIPKNMPVVARTAVVHWLDEEGIHTRLWLGDSVYDVDLYPDGMSKTQQQFYCAVGYWRSEDEQIVEDF